MTDVLDFEITMLSPDEAKDIWRTQTRRAPDFAKYQRFMDEREVGDSFTMPVPGSNPENARTMQYNFNEAAKHRSVYYESVKGAPGAFEDVDGAWVAPRPEPVVLRWRRDTRDVKETVTDANGATGEVEVRKVDRLRALVVSTESVTKRGPRKRTNVPSDANGTTGTTDVSADNAVSADSAVSAQTDNGVETPQNAPERVSGRKARNTR
jgi:hypothetical protein